MAYPNQKINKINLIKHSTGSEYRTDPITKPISNLPDLSAYWSTKSQDSSKLVKIDN